jgi:NADH dehydrogenase [ubiquinone] 1 alpha subcomplex assembly factor 7
MRRRFYSTFSRLVQNAPAEVKPKIKNPLIDVLKQELRAGAGVPMSVHRFMELGLSHPAHGYYSTKDKIFNKGGDFTTSPEISQMFGESLGIWMIAAM